MYVICESNESKSIKKLLHFIRVYLYSDIASGYLSYIHDTIVLLLIYFPIFWNEKKKPQQIRRRWAYSFTVNNIIIQV